MFLRGLTHHESCRTCQHSSKTCPHVLHNLPVWMGSRAYLETREDDEDESQCRAGKSKQSAAGDHELQPPRKLCQNESIWLRRMSLWIGSRLGQGLSWRQACPTSRAICARFCQGVPRQMHAKVLWTCAKCWGSPIMAYGCAGCLRPRGAVGGCHTLIGRQQEAGAEGITSEPAFCKENLHCRIDLCSMKLHLCSLKARFLHAHLLQGLGVIPMICSQGCNYWDHCTDERLRMYMYVTGDHAIYAAQQLSGILTRLHCCAELPTEAEAPGGAGAVAGTMNSC